MKRDSQTEKRGTRKRGLSQTPSLRPEAAAPSLSGSFRFNEAVGKVIDQITWVSMPGDVGAFEVRFTDDTFLFLEPLPRFVFRARLLRSTDGQIEDLRDYGVLPDRAVA
ncbi:hypothetical protein [Acidicapsa ligni]|uniref:hypothetical protein n=1 Tax=Acidicapsa ligni TaxID=542300 RepID=UPI0021DF51F4|nr:hypothetical protein [Acidicapsa ligni]